MSSNNCDFCSDYELWRNFVLRCLNLMSVGYFCEAILEVIQLIFRKFHFFLARKTGLKILRLSNLERVEQVSQEMLIRKADNSAAVKEIKFS